MQPVNPSYIWQVSCWMGAMWRNREDLRQQKWWRCNMCCICHNRTCITSGDLQGRKEWWTRMGVTLCVTSMKHMECALHIWCVYTNTTDERTQNLCCEKSTPLIHYMLCTLDDSCAGVRESCLQGYLCVVCHRFPSMPNIGYMWCVTGGVCALCRVGVMCTGSFVCVKN